MNILLLRLANNFLRLARLEPSDLRGRPDFQPYDSEESEVFEQAKYLDEIEAPEPMRTNWSEESTGSASDELKEFVEEAFELYIKAENAINYFEELVNGIEHSHMPGIKEAITNLNSISEQLDENYEYIDEYSCNHALKIIEKYLDQVSLLMYNGDEFGDEIRYSGIDYGDVRWLTEEMRTMLRELSGIVKEFEELKDLHQEALSAT